MNVDDFRAPSSEWCWQSIDADTAAEQWRALTAWVGWLRGRYPIAEQLPGCWWRHSELVEEVTALWLAWLAAYNGYDANMTRPIDFHDHWFPSFLARVRRWGVQCTDEHRPRPECIYADAAVDDPAAFADFVGDAPRARQAGPACTHSWLDRLPVAAVHCLVDQGYARCLGDLESAPVLICDDFWLPTGTIYVRVVNEVLHRQLARQDHRQMLAAQSLDDMTVVPLDAAHDDEDGRLG